MKPSHTRALGLSLLAGVILAILYLRGTTPALDRLIPVQHLDSSAQSSTELTPPIPTKQVESPTQTPSFWPGTWPGWDHIEHMVVFGDSITTTHFLVDHGQPSEENPLGNPEWPGLSTANGPNWVGHLTGKYNVTFLKTVNLAYGGATVDKAIVRPTAPDARSFKEQILNVWLPNYFPPPASFDWKSNNTLFVTFLGNNDVRDASHWHGSATEPVLEKDIERYSALLDQLYNNGARNILVMNVMPLERAPMIARNETRIIAEMRNLVQAYNRNLTRMVSTFSDTHPDAKLLEFDTYDLFNRVLNDPCSFDETCALQQLTNYCHQYRLERHNPYKFDERCNFPADQYFWLSPNHPNFRVHDALAKDLAGYLNSVT